MIVSLSPSTKNEEAAVIKPNTSDLGQSVVPFDFMHNFPQQPVPKLIYADTHTVINT